MEQLNEYAKEISDVRRDMFIYDTIIVENCKHYDDGTGIKPKIIPPKYDIRQVRKIEINGQAVLTSKGLARAMASKLPGD